MPGATFAYEALTDEAQSIVNKYSYDPFGNVGTQVEAIAQPFKYVGQFGVMSEPNGFYYMRARYYDPQVGRFISEDPLGFGGGDVNLMAYVGNNPVNNIDPLGLYNDPLDYVIVFGGVLTTYGIVTLNPVAMGVGAVITIGGTLYQSGPGLVKQAKEMAGEIKEKVLEPARKKDNETIKQIDGFENMTTAEKKCP
ncbi:MAG: RHS repeat-associated core domain-containing protein [Nitrospirae bacterium]|nr:RHS repeat-associated core domain-containing protein [Nitrospirota bacterium]